MKMTISEFESHVENMKSLPSAERSATARLLKSAQVEDEDGQPVTVRIVEAPGDATDGEKITKMIDSALKGSQPKAKPIVQPTGKSAGEISFGRRYRPTNFTGPDAERKAFAWGAWALAAMGRSEKAVSWCERNGIEVKSGQVEGTNTLGGYLVPEELDREIIDLRLQYGVFRRNARTRGMTSDLRRIPRRVGGLTAHFVGEAQAGTRSQKIWDQITLSAKKLMVLALMSSELSEDAVVELGDDLAGEIAYAFSYKEDLCGFIGDATSDYSGILGVAPKLAQINGVDDGGGLVLASGNLWGEITIADLRRVVARVPSYARMNAKWYCSPRFLDEVIFRLIDTVGGNTVRDMQAERALQALGYPVELAEVMPTAEANSQVACLFGDLAKAASFGDRRATTIDFATTGTVDGIDVFSTDQIAVRGTERFDINVHDVGTATTAGPIVGLITAAS